MLEYSYTECTGSCIRSLAFAERALGDDLPPELRARTRDAVRRGVEFVLGQQHASGAWPGFWGINFTYGTLFSVSGLLAAGLGRSHQAIVRAVRWLVSRQRPDGGWGESWEGMLDDSEVPLADDDPSLVVQTAWALLTLLEAAPEERETIDRGVAFLAGRQTKEGSWPQERATGCFFNTAVLDYAMYRNIFPTWALARYLSLPPSR
jgi:lanosterol synthase